MKARLFSDYGMLLVLLALCALFSALTIKEQAPESDSAASELAARITERCARDDIILAVGARNRPSAGLARKLGAVLKEKGFTRVREVVGTPRDLRAAIDRALAAGEKPAVIATGGYVRKWRLLDQIPTEYPALASCRIELPRTYVWPDFLKRSNLLAIVDRIVVIAVIAVGMTMVIITAGIDLSVGSLIALSAVISTLLMKKMGGLEGSAWAVLLGFSAGIVSCGVVGGLGGYLVARFRVAPFITTLGIMMMARGLAFMITGGFSIYQVPKALTWLGQGRSLYVPNTVILLLLLYAAAHIFMSHTRWGRYIYAVGGNSEAARLSGVPVRFIVVFVYVISGLAAGLGGCIQASQLNTGTPSMGVMYELYVIAAVVVGGTSLAGGSGRILGTLIGAFIISVIQNGMNLLGIESYTQQVVLGAVILGAVLMDKARSGGGVPRPSTDRAAPDKAIAAGRKVSMKRNIYIAAGVLVLGLVAFLGVRRVKSGARCKIGMTCMDLTNPFFKLIADVMREEAARYDYDVVPLSGGLDPARQNNQLSDFAAQGYDAIFLNPVDSKSAGEGVKKAYAAGVPVFTFDVQVTDAVAKKLITSHIGSDNFQGGRLAAESMMQATGDRGKIAIVSLPEITSCIYRVDGFKDYLREKNSNLRIVTELTGKGNREGGYAVATDILQAYPDLVGIFAVNDPSALGAYAAVQKAGKADRITVIGFDASPAGKQAVFEKKLYDSPQQFPRKMARGTVQAFARFLEGEDLPADDFIPCAHYRYKDSVNDPTRVQEQW